MVKDLRYIIKRIIIGIGIALALMYIKGNFLLVTNAQVLIDNNQLSYNNYLVLQPGSSQFHFTDSTVYQDISIFPQYFLLTMCTDSNNINSWSTVNSTLVNVNFYNTQISCSFPNSTYTGGHITYIYGQVNAATGCSVNLTNCYQDGYINFTVPNRSSWALLSYQLSKDVINIDYGSNTIINQNQMILSGQQSIINNQTQNTQDIIDNQNSNSQDIIDNQNQNTQDIQDTITGELQTCVDAHSVYPIFIGIQLNTGSGRPNRVSLNSNNSGGVVDVSKYVGQHITITFNELDTSKAARTNYCFTNTNANSTSLSCLTSYISGNVNSSRTFSDVLVPEGAKYLYLVGYNNYSDETWVSHSTVHFPRICTNKLNDINDSLTDDSGVSNSEINDLFGDLQESNSPVSDLLTLPITLLQAYLTGFNSSCSPYNLGSLYGTNLILPCIDIPRYIGNSLWSVVDALCCIYMIYNIAMLFVSVYESFTSLDDSMQLLYSPQHANSRVAQRGGTYDG